MYFFKELGRLKPFFLCLYLVLLQCIYSFAKYHHLPPPPHTPHCIDSPALCLPPPPLPTQTKCWAYILLCFLPLSLSLLSFVLPLCPTPFSGTKTRNSICDYCIFYCSLHGRIPVDRWRRCQANLRVENRTQSRLRGRQNSRYVFTIIWREKEEEKTVMTPFWRTSAATHFLSARRASSWEWYTWCIHCDRATIFYCKTTRWSLAVMRVLALFDTKNQKHSQGLFASASFALMWLLEGFFLNLF